MDLENRVVELNMFEQRKGEAFCQFLWRLRHIERELLISNNRRQSINKKTTFASNLSTVDSHLVITKVCEVDRIIILILQIRTLGHRVVK